MPRCAFPSDTSRVKETISSPSGKKSNEFFIMVAALISRQKKNYFMVFFFVRVSP
jgi:hypothetical protein